MGDWTGTVPTILAGDIPTGDDWKVMTDIDVALTGAWTSYTPTWASFGTQPAIGNGTLTGRYARVGKRIAFSIDLVIGSTTTFGTNLYTLSIPATAAANQVCVAYLEDNSTGFRYVGAAGILVGGAILNPIVFTNGTSGFSSSSPVTLATGDVVRTTGEYEAT